MPPSNLRTLRREEAALVQRLDDVHDKILRLEAVLAGRKPRLRTGAKTTRRARRSVSRRPRRRARR